MSSNMMMPTAINDKAPRPLRELYFELGRSLLLRERFADAILAYQHALEEEDTAPDAGIILFYLARTLEQDGNKRDAFHTYLEAILRTPARCSVILPYAQQLLTRARALHEKQWLRQEWEKQIVGTDIGQADYAQVAFFLGRVNLYIEAYSAALDYFQQAMQFLADDTRVVEGYGEALWKVGNYEEAEKVLYQVRDMVSQKGDPQRLTGIDVKLAQVCADDGSYYKALPLISLLLERSTSYHFELLLSRCQCYLALGDAQRGLEAADAAIVQNATSVQAYLLRTCALNALGRYEEAITSTNQALQIDPSNRQILFYNSQALIEGQIDLEKGRSLLNRYIERVGQEAVSTELQSPIFTARSADGNAHYFLAEFYSMIKDVDRALEEVNLALEYGLHGTISYPETSVYRLKAELLEASDNALEAAAAYEDAGNNYCWRNDYQTAVTLLEKASSLNRDSAPIYWNLSNALFFNSLLEDYPFVKAEVLAQSRDVWEKGIGFGLPAVENSWVYLLKGFINDRLVPLTSDYPERLGLVWEAIAYIERALLLHEPEVYRWAYLSRYHRTLYNESNALEATRKALAYDENNVTALDEHSAILANVGRFDEAMAAIEKRLGLETNTWSEAVKAYVLMHTGEKEKALDTIEKVIQSPATDVWFRALRARCYRALDRQSSAIEDYKAIWESYKESDLNNLFDFAWAAFYLGKVDKAIEMMQQVLLDPLQEDSSAHVGLGRFYFEKGDLPAAEKHLNLFVNRLINPRQLNDFLEFDYIEIQKAYAERADCLQIMALLNQTREKVQARREQLAQEKSPLEEMQQCIAQYRDSDGSDDRVIVGISASVARLRREQKDWSGAAADYRFLQGFPALFPEASRGLEAIFEALQTEGDALLKPSPAAQKTPDPVGALARYSKLLSIELFTKDRIRQAGLHARLGLASLATGDGASAHQHFLSTFRLSREGTKSEPGEHLGLVCSTLLTDVNLYWALEDEWRALSNAPSTDEQLRHDLKAARSALQQFLYQEYQLSPDAVSLPPVERLILEVGEGLVPEDTSNNMPLVRDYIPSIRQQMSTRWGARLPLVRVRDNTQLGDNEYLIMLDEIPLVRATIPLAMGFCLAPATQLQQLGIPAGDLKEAVYPLDGSPCCWIAPSSWPIVTEHQLELWTDPFLFIASHLRALLLQRPAEFVRPQDIDALIENWKQSELGIALIRAALPDDFSRFRLSQVLRALLKERVPIIAWEGILTEFHEAMLHESDLQDTLRAIRLRLRLFLPGNVSDMKLIELPPELEDKIVHWTSYQYQTWVFTASPQEAWELLSTIHALVGPNGEGCALVVQRAELRWFVRQLVEMIFPALLVLSQEELLSSIK